MSVAAAPTHRRASPPPWPPAGSRDRAQVAVVLTIAAASGIAGWFAAAAPTGVAPADGVYRAAYAVAVTWACAYARPWTWPIAAGAPLLAGQGGTWAVVAGGALTAAVVGQFSWRWTRRHGPVLGAVVGALAASCLLRLPDVVAFGVPSLIALAAPLPAVLSAARAARPRTRRLLAVLTGVATCLAVAALAVFAAGALQVREHARVGVDHARSGLEALRNGEQYAAAKDFRDAEAAFDRAHVATSTAWLRPLAAVPVLHQHLDAARTLAAEGARISAASAEASPAVSVRELTHDDGRFRIDRIESLQPLARRVVDVLERSRSELGALSSGWLTSPVTDAVDTLRGEVDETLATARITAEALEVAPSLLGAEGPRTYLVLFANPAEARELGGFVASVGLLTAEDGVLVFESLPTPANLSQALRFVGAELEVPVPGSMAAALPEDHVENWTDSPDIATVDAVATSLLPVLGVAPPDGVVYVDPRGLAALLELTGPVTIPETQTVLTADNAADHLLRGQYSAVGFQAGDERKERLGLAGEAAFDQLLAGPIPGPRRFAEVLSPLVAQRRLLFSTSDPAAHRLLEDVGLRPPLAREGDDGGETLLVTHGNRRSNKLDAYLHRSITYDATVDAAGRTRSTVTVELRNEAPVEGLAEHQLTQGRPGDPVPRTTNVLTLTLYSRSTLDAVAVDGEAVGRNEASAHGLHQYAVPVSVPAQSGVRVTFELSGDVDPAACSVTFLPNAGANDDVVQATVRGPGGATASLAPRTLDDEVTLRCGR